MEVVRTPQHCSARLSRQQESKSANYVNTCPPQEKVEIIMNVEPRVVENKTSDLCGLPVKTSRFKRHDFCGNLFSFLTSKLSNNIENIFIDLLFPKTKPITVGVIYKPPNQTRFLEQIITEFETLDLHNEHYVLGDFNINLLFKGKYIFDKPDEFRQFYKELSPEIKTADLFDIRL